MLTNKQSILSPKQNIAIAIAIELASHDGILTVEQLAKQLNLSQSYVEQITSMLRKGGVITSVRGPGGGYLIDSQRITVRDVAIAMNDDAFNCDPTRKLYSRLESLMARLPINRLV
ncbi:RrF2 family transcriptional regulator [Vibrio harveyi]|uniref:RrF2 family transcriptional regulator n=1 Tax=Vibrio harveyi TaxID=669 RepID=UPI0025AFBE1D|nr:Rrf2 family transcriptional regulator [Vibrio harveyi]WJT09264.1 Rrf2 family transcriptional regulator [Vibrio harveyi]